LEVDEKIMSNITKGSGIIYTTGKPNTIPQTSYDAEFAIDTTGNQYAWNRTNNVWDSLGQGIEIATSSVAPTHTPNMFRPRFVVTPSREMYFYSGSWAKVNALPSGVYSSSAQIGPTGIYSGSGTITAPRIVNISSSLYTYDAQFLLGAASNYQVISGDGFKTIGFETIDDADQMGFIGFIEEEAAVPTIYSRNAVLSNLFGKFYATPTQTVWQMQSGSVDSVILNTTTDKMHYQLDYSTEIYNKPRSIPDVGTITSKIMPYSKTVLFEMSQAGIGDPTLTKYHDGFNTTYTAARAGTGVYKITAATSVFTAPVMLNFSQVLSNNAAYLARGYKMSDTEIMIESYDSSGNFAELETDLPLIIEISLFNS
jgi:hypothetical protein